MRLAARALRARVEHAAKIARLQGVISWSQRLEAVHKAQYDRYLLAMTPAQGVISGSQLIPTSVSRSWSWFVNPRYMKPTVHDHDNGDANTRDSLHVPHDKWS